MKRWLFVAVLAWMLVVPARADEAPFNYQGRLLGSNGQPVNASVTVSVNIYTSAAEGTAVCSEYVGPVLVQNGLYSFSYGTNLSVIRRALTGQDGWIELVINGSGLAPRQRLSYTPYALSLDERGLVQSTEFLLNMIAKHELEIQALRARAGMPNTSGGPQYLVETFPDADGQNNLVNLGLTDAVYDHTNGLYRAAPIIFDSSVVAVTNCQDYTEKDIYLAGRVVRSVESEMQYAGSTDCTGYVSFGWLYEDGVQVSNTVSMPCSGNMARIITNSNPRFTNQVQWMTIRVWMEPEGCPPQPFSFSERNTRFYCGLYDTTLLALNIPAVTGRCSHAALYAYEVAGAPADSLQFSLTDGSATVSNVSLGVKCPLGALSNNPTRVDILMTPPTNGLPAPALESVMFKWWTD
jgi:hypothetical protein